MSPAPPVTTVAAVAPYTTFGSDGLAENVDAATEAARAHRYRGGGA